MTMNSNHAGSRSVSGDDRRDDPRQQPACDQD